MNNRLMRRSLALIFGPALAAAPFAAQASGFALLEQNASGLGNAYAGQAAIAEDASTIFFNPAGLTRLQGRQALLGVDLISPSAKFSNSGSASSGTPAVPTSIRPLGGDGGDAGSLAAVPSAYLSWQINPQWWAGIGVNAPFGQKTEYSSDWVGRFQGVKSQIETINVNPTVAWKINDNVSLGLGANYQRLTGEFTSQANYSVAVFGGLVPVLGTAGAAAAAGTIPANNREGLVTIKGADDSWGWNAGALFRLSPTTDLGLSYRSEIKYRINGSVRFDSAPTFGGLLAGVNASFTTSNAYADVKLPASAAATVTHQLNNRWTLMGTLAWTGWSSIQTLAFYRENGALINSTPENFRDTYRIALGANYRVNDQWMLRTGVAYDQSPVRSQNLTPRLPDQARTWLAVGAQWRMNPTMTVDVGYAHLFASNTSISQNEGNQAVYGLLQGNYKVSVDLLGAQMAIKF